MKFFLNVLCLVALTRTVFCANGSIGMNTYYFDSWAGQIAFVDAMLQFSRWTASTVGSDEWDSGVKIPLGPKGFPLEIPYTPAGGSPQVAKANMYAEIGSHFPGGTYTLMFEGTGEIQIGSERGLSTFSEAGTHPVDIGVGQWGITLQINESSAQDPVRNIRLIHPGHAQTYQTAPFYPAFLERLRGFRCIRATHPVNFGSWPCDNDVEVTDASCVMRWATRSTTDYHPQAGFRGLAPGYHVDIANAVGADLWACVVHGAEDDFVRQYATFLRDRLNPAHRVYLELSNETWNTAGDFPQSVYFTNLGTAWGLDDPNDPRIGREKAFVRRCGQVFKIFEEVFSGQMNRLLKVMPTQFSHTYITESRLTYMNDNTVNTSGVKADALAVGAYFGGHVPDEIVARAEHVSITVDSMLDIIDNSIDHDQPSAINPGSVNTSFLTRLQANVQLADSFGVKLISYEGGPYPNLSTRNEGLQSLRTKIIEANRDPRMETIYNRMLNIWFEHTDGIFMAFPYVGTYANNALGGHLEYMDQDTAEAPKFRTLLKRLQDSITSVRRTAPMHANAQPEIRMRHIGRFIEIDKEDTGTERIFIFQLSGRMTKCLIVTKGTTLIDFAESGNRCLLWRSQSGSRGFISPSSKNWR